MNEARTEQPLHPFIALIPARGGSKSVPRKNLRTVAGKPLLAYTIEAAVQSCCVSDVYLSSDDQEMLKLATSLGVHPIDRPAQFATDDATARDVVTHFLSTLEHGLIAQDPFIVYLQPTSPLRSASHLDEAIKAMIAAGRQSLVSVTALEKSPFKSFTLAADGTLRSLFEEKYSNFNRQQLPPAFVPNGAIYVFRVSEFIRRGGFPSDGSHPYMMTAAESIDVDGENDLKAIEEHLGKAYERI